MRFISYLFLINLACSLSFAATLPSNTDQLKLYCAQKNGTLTTQWTCPLTGEVRRDGPFCTIRDSASHVQVTNGCTGTHGTGQQFFKACVLHDFCYHNHAFIDGKTKAGCDDQFLKNMYAICDQPSPQIQSSGFGCYFLARDIFYEGVHHFGDNSWNCSNTQTSYPHSFDDVDTLFRRSENFVF